MLRSNLQGYTHTDAEGAQCYSHSDKTLNQPAEWVGILFYFFFNSNVIIPCPVLGLIEISTVERGVVSLYGVKSELFVAMNSRGRLYGTTVFHDECKFKESLLPNNYNAYESLVYRGSYIALSKHGRVKRGNKATTAMTVTHFLPRI